MRETWRAGNKIRYELQRKRDKQTQHKTNLSPGKENTPHDRPFLSTWEILNLRLHSSLSPTEKLKLEISTPVLMAIFVSAARVSALEWGPPS